MMMPPHSRRRRTFSCISACEASVAVGTQTGDVFLFDGEKCMYRTSIDSCEAGVHAIAFVSPTCIAVGAGDGSIALWQGRDLIWKSLDRYTSMGAITSLDFDTDTAQLLFSTQTGLTELLRVQQRRFASVSAASVESDASEETLPFDKDDLVYHLTHSATVSQTHAGVPTVVAVASGRNDVFASADDTGRVYLWDVVTMRVIAWAKLSCAAATLHLEFAREEYKVIAGCIDGSIRCVVLSTGDLSGAFAARCRESEVLWAIPSASKGSVRTLQVTQLRVAHRNTFRALIAAGDSGIVRVWNADTRQFVTQLAVHSRSVVALTADTGNFNQNGDDRRAGHVWVHSCSNEGTLTTFDCDTLSLAPVLHHGFNGHPLCMAQRKQGERELLLGTSDGSVYVFDEDIAAAVSTLDLQEPVNYIAISPNEKYVAVAAGATITIFTFDTSGNTQLREFTTLSFHTRAVTCVAWTPDCRQLFACANDGSITVSNMYFIDEDLYT
ncbi:MAG: hypothetical protein MHM6MM_004786 [Cercozoa sp. M6MM]